MITAKQREVSFRDAFKKLLEEHQAQIEATNDCTNLFNVTMFSVYIDDELVKDYCEFDV